MRHAILGGGIELGGAFDDLALQLDVELAQALLGVAQGDTEADAQWLAEKVAALRIFTHAAVVETGWTTSPTFTSLVPAATVVSQGPGWATVEVVGPLLPADVATKTPAFAAYRNAISAGSRKLVCVPLIE